MLDLDFHGLCVVASGPNLDFISEGEGVFLKLNCFLVRVWRTFVKFLTRPQGDTKKDEGARNTARRHVWSSCVTVTLLSLHYCHIHAHAAHA